MKRVVVTRAAGQASGLAARLRAAGFEPLVVPVIGTGPPVDGGVGLRAAVERLEERYDWVVVTSPTAAAVFADVIAPGTCRVPLAAVGPGTADALEQVGLRAALLPERSMAEGLLEAMSALPAGRVLLPQAAGARAVLAEGLRSLGWEVTAVQAYRTLHLQPDRAVLSDASRADAIVFTSSSTVDAWIEAAGPSLTPGVVVSIGPATSATIRARGLHVGIEADPHTLEGVVAAVESALAG